MQLKHPEADARMARSRGLADYWPWLLRYPLTGYSLPVLVMLVAFIGFALGTARLPMGIPDTGLPLLCISLLLAVFYTLRVIDHTTQGYATPPPMGGEALHLFGAMKPLSLPAMVVLTAVALHPEHPALLRLLLVGAALVLPAYLFILATEENLASALNPLRWLKVISVMGLAYLAPCTGFLASGWLLTKVLGTLGLIPLLLLCVYLLIAFAHLLGFVGTLHRHALGLQRSVQDPDEALREQDHQRQLKALLLYLQQRLQAGDEPSALQAVASHSGGPLDALRFHEELLLALDTQGSPALIHATGQRLIALLLKAHRGARALDVAEHCLHRQRGFAPQNPEQLEALLRQALLQGYAELYELLLKSADADAHAAEPAWAGVQRLRVHHASEVLKDDAAALALMQPLLAQTKHPSAAEFARHAQTLKTLLERRTR